MKIISTPLPRLSGHVLILLAAVASAVSATPFDGRHETLENGLQIVVKENHTAPVADVRIYVKTGSIYEHEYMGSGISHVFEHLINGGTTSTRSEKEINALIDTLGGANNAYTTKGHTCYFIKTTAEQVGDAIDLMADWMINSTFPDNEFQREIGVVLEELYKGREEPRRLLYNRLYETMFRTHPARHPVIGYENLIRSITRDDIIAYYKRMYVPNNMVIVAAGSFDQNVVVGRIRQAFSSAERRSLTPAPLPDEPAQLGERSSVLTKPGLGETYFSIAYHTVPIHHTDLYALDVASYILSHGRSSRLVRKLKEDDGVVSSIYSYSATPEFNAGAFVIGGTCKAENVDTALAAVSTELAALATVRVGDDAISKAIKQKIADDILGNQTASDEAERLGVNVITTGNPNFDTVYLEGIRSVTATDIERVARRYFQPANRTVVRLESESTDLTASSRDAAVEATAVRKETLENGLRLLVKRNPNIPLINLKATFIGGVLHEPPGQAGISRIMAEMLTRGTATRSREEIAETFDRIGGRYSSSSGNNTFSLSVEVLKEDFDVALDLFTEMIRDPSFPAKELDTVRDNTLSAIAARSDNWNSDITTKFRRHFFGDHPYGNDTLGEKGSVESLTRDDVRACYQRLTVPTRGVVTIFGDVDPETALAAARERFGTFVRKSQPLPTRNANPEPQADKVITETVDKSLAAVYVGYPGITIDNNADRFPLLLLDTILSGYGYPGGRLHERLRGSERDLVYVVHAFNFIGIDPGYFGIIAASSPEKMAEVVQIILEEVDTIRENRVSDEALNNARVICKTMETLSRQTNDDMALQAALDELYGLGYDFSDHFPDHIDAVTAEDVQRVARRYLSHHLVVRTLPTTP